MILNLLNILANTIDISVFGFSFGQFDPAQTSLPIITFLVALIDGFNPCAMWVLLFLITLLLDLKQAWKRWYLGGVFIITSGISYYAFLASWLTLNEFIGLIPLTRAIIALAAWIVGLITLKSYFTSKQSSGCSVKDKEEQKTLFQRVKSVVERQNLALATLGIIILAFSVNLFELMCSFALPATYTNILASQAVEGLSKWLYLLLYAVVFMLDDILVFGIAMVTLQATGITTRFQRTLKLVSGVVMLVLAAWITYEVLQGFQIVPT